MTEILVENISDKDRLLKIVDDLETKKRPNRALRVAVRLLADLRDEPVITHFDIDGNGKKERFESSVDGSMRVLRQFSDEGAPSFMAALDTINATNEPKYYAHDGSDWRLLETHDPQVDHFFESVSAAIASQ